jgi:vacuolar-type H+-ATPase subunit I/STV1
MQLGDYSLWLQMWAGLLLLVVVAKASHQLTAGLLIGLCAVLAAPSPASLVMAALFCLVVKLLDFLKV